MDIQRLRNLTTRKLHTEMQHVYQDIECLTGTDGIMTHQIPNAMRALDPWLRERVTDERFWDGEYDPDHQGEIEIAPMTSDETAAFFQRYGELPHPFAGKDVVAVVVDDK